MTATEHVKDQRFVLKDIGGISSPLSLWLQLMGEGNFATSPCRDIQNWAERYRR